MARHIRARRGDGAAGLGNQPRRDGMRRHAKRHGVETRAHQQGQRTVIASRQNERQGTGPERLRQRARERREIDECFGFCEIPHMHDQRIELWPPLGGEDRGDSLAVGRVGTEAIDRLGRECDQTAVAQNRGRAFDCARVGGLNVSNGVHGCR